jgi:hypothetical protein
MKDEDWFRQSKEEECIQSKKDECIQSKEEECIQSKEDECIQSKDENFKKVWKEKVNIEGSCFVLSINGQV